MIMIRFLKLSLLVCALVVLAPAHFAVADLPAAAPAANAPRPAAVQHTAIKKPIVFARIVIDSIYCEKESKWDHGTSQDEPYVMVTGFASHRQPNAWTLGKPEVFKDVDSGNNRRFTKQNRIVFEGEVPKGEAIGFHVVLWERDASPEDTQYNLYQQLCRRINDNIVTSINTGGKVAGLAGRMVGGIYGMVHSGWIAVIQQALSVAGGGGDDKVAEAVVGYDHDEIARWAQSDPNHRVFRVVLDGKDEGKYWLRYHMEFLENATSEFAIKFTEWDDMAISNMDRVDGDEIVIVSDEDASGDTGRFYIYSGLGRLVRSFDAPYAAYDRLALADTTGNGVSEILTASPSGGGLVRSYDPMGSPMNRMNIPFARYDGFAAGDLDGDGKAEIVIGSASDRKVRIHSSLDGRKIDEFGLNWPFKGTRYTSKNTRHDVLLVGDVVGDGKAEIVMIENKNNNTSTIRVYNQKGSEVVNSTVAGNYGATFTNYDAAALADMYGDAKKELIMVTSDDTQSYTYATTIVDLATSKRAGARIYPWYGRYCGFAAGKVLPGSKAQIVVAQGVDKKLYIGR